tara:strand:+ start:293 stop:754 length:462 start_codon:yes stop_codon:yes gene_type:complete
MTIHKLEDVKEIKVFTPIVERWEIYEKPEEYLRLYVNFMSFENIELEKLEAYSQEIIGKTDKEFLQWLIEKSEDEGSVFEFLEYELDLNPDYDYEKFFNENTEEEIPEDSEIIEDEDFGLANSQPFPEFMEEYFISEKDAIKSISKEYPFFNN